MIETVWTNQQWSYDENITNKSIHKTTSIEIWSSKSILAPNLKLHGMTIIDHPLATSTELKSGTPRCSTKRDCSCCGYCASEGPLFLGPTKKKRWFSRTDEGTVAIPSQRLFVLLLVFCWTYRQVLTGEECFLNPMPFPKRGWCFSRVGWKLDRSPPVLWKPKHGFVEQI